MRKLVKKAVKVVVTPVATAAVMSQWAIVILALYAQTIRRNYGSNKED